MYEKDRNVQDMLRVLQSYAPTGNEQQVCSDWVNEVRSGKPRSALSAGSGPATDDQVIRMLAGAIVDGMDHGNWPRVVQRLNRATRPKATRPRATKKE
jgi:hypothetical protein